MEENREPRPRRPSELIKKGYSETELNSIYSLGRLFLETGQIRKAENIFLGLNNLVPDFYPAWLGSTAVLVLKKDLEGALKTANQAFKINPKATETEIFLSCCLISVRDYNAAGTYLGEIAEKIDAGLISDPDLIRFFRAQLARYQVAVGK